MKYLTNFLFIFISSLTFANMQSEVFKISYSSYNNGEKSGRELSIFYQEGFVYLSEAEDKIQNFTDLNNQQNISTIQYDGKTYGLITPFDELPTPTAEDDTEEILGYTCKHLSYSYFSNRIDVWYTEETAAKGSPYNRYIPGSNALVLKVVINNNREIKADAVVEVKDHEIFNNFTDNTVIVSQAEFEEIKIRSRYTSIQVFKDEQINFDPGIKSPSEDQLQVDQTYHFSKGSVIMKKIKLPSASKNGDYVFAKLHCKSNGDAYDRTGSVFIVPTGKEDEINILNAYLHGLEELPVFTDNKGDKYQGIVREGNYTPPLEIMRFFTSFGANHFNDKRAINNYDWAENVVYKQDVSSLIPLDQDELWVGVFIGNYDSGGHIVSLELDVYPSFGSDEEQKVSKYIQPLFSTVNTLEMSGQNYGRLFGNDTLKVSFEVNDDLEHIRLLYTSTGHGGWGGGDEFNPKLNQIFLDGEPLYQVVPWRTDCATYRLSNPASGNFGNGLSSSDLSRSNWCPATLTPPFVIPLDILEQGQHTIEVVIDQGENEGSSFSHWGITGVLVGDIVAK